MTVGASGSLARYATEKGRFGSDGGVKPKLFEPNRNLELSVFRIDGLDRARIREIGVAVAERHPSARRLHGWGEIAASDVANAGLRTAHDDTPPRHANVVGWPEDAAERKLKTQILARAARAVRLDPPIDVAGAAEKEAGA